jgi:hypothetical protein
MDWTLDEYQQQKMAGAFGCCAIGTCRDPYCYLCVVMPKRFGPSKPLGEARSTRETANPTRAGEPPPRSTLWKKSKRKGPRR